MSKSNIIFAKLDGTFWSNPKVIRAGLHGACVFLHAMCQNATRGGSGSIPATDMEPWFVARQLGISEGEAMIAIKAACHAQLVTCHDDRVTLNGWDSEWARRPLTDAERQANRRERQKEASDSHEANVTSHAKVTRHGSEKRREEEREARVTRSENSLSGFDSPDPDPEQPHTNAQGRPQQPAATNSPRFASSSSSPAGVNVAAWEPPAALRETVRLLGCDPAHELVNFRLNARARQNTYPSVDAVEAAFEKFCRGSHDKGRRQKATPAPRTKPRTVKLDDGRLAEIDPETGDYTRIVSREKGAK